MAITSRLIGKFGGGSELQEWYYNHPSSGEIPKNEENPVIAKVEEASPEEPTIVMIEANVKDSQAHNNPWEEMTGGWSSSGVFYNGKEKHTFFVTEPSELRLTGFNRWQSSGVYHTRAYIVRLSDYVPL